MLDLLRVAVAAGLSPGRALAEVGRRHPGVLAAELARAAAHAALGVPRADTYAELERRAPAAGVPALVAALAARRPPRRAARAHARRRGARPPAPAPAQRAAEQAARAAPQIQLVVALLLVPAVLLLVAAALLPAIVPT